MDSRLNKRCWACGAESKPLGMHAGNWFCVDCMPDVVCECGASAKAIGIERYATPSADTNAYAMPQVVQYLCDDAHQFSGEKHDGPANKRPH